MKNKRDMEISIEVTHDCSCKCRMCSSDAWHPSPIKNELTTQEVYSILLEGTEIGANILSLSGGEPSVRDDVFEIIDIAKNMGYKKILYYTSGTQFDEDENVVPLKESTMEKLAEYKATVIFDFQNCDEKKENWLFDIDDYFKMREGVVKRLVEMGVRTEGHFVPMTVNYSNIFSTCEYASELGIKRMSFLRHVVQGRSRQNLGLMISPKQFADMQWIFLSLIDEKIIDVRLGHPIDFTPLYDSSRKWETCRGGHDAPLIKPNGDVDMCPAWKNLPYVAGNLREKSLKEIWYESKYYKAFREFSENKHKDAVGFCADCPYLSKCKMGCTAQRLIWNLHPDDIKEAMLYGVDPMCPYYNGFTP